MTEFPTPGRGDERPRDRLDDQHGYPPGEQDSYRHRGRGRFGRPGREPDLQALLSDQPIGTTAEALAEAFLGVGQLLRARARSHRGGQRRAAGLTFARAALLAALDTDGPQRMGQLAHRLGVVPRTVTPMVDALEDEGLLVREPDPDDRRATLLRITDEGIAELSRTRSDRRSAVDEVFAALSDDERSALAGALEKLRTAARAGLDPGAVNVPPHDGPTEDDGPDRHHGPQHSRGRGRLRRAHHDGPPHHRRGHHRAPSGRDPRGA
jgi:DNA-binding MarR family transcriptional regulator